MTKNCKNCGKNFEAKRKTAEYCSAKCRVEYSRVSVTTTSGPSVTLKCEKIEKPIDCYECQRKDRALIADGKKPEGCTCQWWWSVRSGEHCDVYHGSWCI